MEPIAWVSALVLQNKKKQTESFQNLWRLTMAARNWTPEQREAQAQRIRQYKPWELSTGAKTSKGKRKVARNGIKHGCSVRMTREAYISLIKGISPALADDSELIDSLVNKLKFVEEAATNEDDLKPIIRQLTRAQSLIKQSKRIVWTIGDVESARKHIDPMVNELLAASSCIMDACELLIKLAKKLEAETKGDPLRVTKIPPNFFENI